MQAHAQYRGREHRDRLAEQGGFGLDASHAPAQYAEAVDHGRVGVGPYQRVGVEQGFAIVLLAENDPREALQVDLVDDTGIGRHDLELAKRLLPPMQEGIALAVALEFEFIVPGQGIRSGVMIDLDRVVHDQFGRRQRVDGLGIAAQRLHRVAHRRQVHDRRNAREVLQDHAGRPELQFLLSVQGREQVRAGDLSFRIAQEILQQDLAAVGELRDFARVERRQSVVCKAASADLKPGEYPCTHYN